MSGGRGEFSVLPPVQGKAVGLGCIHQLVPVLVWTKVGLSKATSTPTGSTVPVPSTWAGLGAVKPVRLTKTA